MRIYRRGAASLAMALLCAAARAGAAQAPATAAPVAAVGSVPPGDASAPGEEGLPPAARDTLVAVRTRLAAERARLAALEQELVLRARQLADLEAMLQAPPAPSPPTARPGDDRPADPRPWFQRVSLRGYTQLRFTATAPGDGAPVEVPSDRSVAAPETFILRRGRLIVSGDVSPHLSFFAQPELAASTSSGDAVVSLRDLFADVTFDAARAWRLRVGQSKVPFGFANLQSSQQRAPLERADATNSAVEGERDLGAFILWAPPDSRRLLADLVSNGLKGAGDYGVVAIGAYAGQGLNKADANDRLHWVGRLSYPFRVGRRQIVELGVQGYTGRFVPSVQALSLPGVTVVPQAPSAGLADQRVAVSATWYPQPVGVEAEWNWGRGPQLADDLQRIEARPLSGGSVQLHYRGTLAGTAWFPFVRWQYYDGGRKAARNAPRLETNEIDVGARVARWAEVEATAMFTHTVRRTRTSLFPYDASTGGNRLGLQLQWNY